jgi:hypothetical protein
MFNISTIFRLTLLIERWEHLEPLERLEQFKGRQLVVHRDGVLWYPFIKERLYATDKRCYKRSLCCRRSFEL